MSLERESLASRTHDAAERRRFGRRSCRVHGWIRANRRARIPCVMTDVSAGGARLAVSEAVRLPHRFLLSFDGLDWLIPCEVRHDAPGIFGVEFSSRRRGQEVGIDKLLTWLNMGTSRT